MINEEYLISIGFSKLYDYKIKKNRDNFLTWANLFEMGNSIRIDLSFNENEWGVSKIQYVGTIATERYESYLKSHNIDDVILFVQKYPMNTF